MTHKIFKQKYTEGDSCDLNNQAREADVHIVCRPNSTDEIIDVVEVATCKYLVTIGTSRLCADPAFKNRQRSLSIIQCHRIVADEDYYKFTAPLLPHSADEFQKLRQTPIQDSSSLFESLINSMRRTISKDIPFKLMSLNEGEETLSSDLKALIEELHDELAGDDNDRDDNAAIALLKHLLKTRASKSKSDGKDEKRKSKEKKSKVNQ